jgi:hypothetical protein
VGSAKSGADFRPRSAEIVDTMMRGNTTTVNEMEF